MCLYAQLNLQTKNKQSHRLQIIPSGILKIVLRRIFATNIRVTLKCGSGFIHTIGNMLPFDRWHTSSYSSSSVSMAVS